VAGGWVNRTNQKPKKDPDWGQICFVDVDIFLVVFLTTPLNLTENRETPKNAITFLKKREKIGFGLLVDFFVKTFRHDLKKKFFVVPLNSHR
jgi:hypothetical protein